MMVNTKEIFISNLRKFRRNKFRTQESFAEAMGFSIRGYQKYEQGETSPTVEMLQKFAEVLECEPWDLITPEDRAEKTLNFTAKDMVFEVFEAIKKQLSSDEFNLLMFYRQAGEARRRDILDQARRLSALDNQKVISSAQRRK